MSEHPPNFDLDAHAAGDDDAKVALHLSTCDGCRAYVESRMHGAAAFVLRDGPNAAAFVAKVERRQRRTPGMLTKAAWIAAPLLAAAALLFLVRTPDRPVLTTVETLPASRFKGNLQVAVVRDRAGAQERLATEVSVLPGDRLRVEIGVDDEKPISVGMLTNDGAWIVLLAPVMLEAGTHFSDRAARFDENPTEGMIIAGDPTEVERARMTRVFSGVSVIPVVLER